MSAYNMAKVVIRILQV